MNCNLTRAVQPTVFFASSTGKGDDELNPVTTALLRKASSLVEETRFRFGTRKFLYLFIDTWAFKQTGLYEPQEQMPAELESVAAELSKVLSTAMRSDPTADVLGFLLSEFRFDQKGTSFFPTPPELGQLMVRLVGEPSSRTFYEPCCGTGGNTLQWLEGVFDVHGPGGIKEVCLLLEDVDPMMVKCSLLQLLHYFESRDASPIELSIVGVDVLTRRPSGVAYHATAMPKTHLSVSPRPPKP